ncbi:WYL domain-containing protein [Streptomyces sp. TRM43335]|uniref:WYL domain-containing protein n=1 Tax=Streptomyces taklimakanensis TaxID=2569853 RepID=A0A6G2B9I1_9ACTN|nr:WYL domain-containing protein [Streptomyces taklimakanensis]MTE18729.1 WYL domain-containing protein [Streptomyces taklimakanensis]
MRAARLIKMVLLLQTRRSMTAAELADRLEVSERTVARDALALSEAGIPVYADRGRTGGYRLVGGYRTRLTGLGRDEAEALFLSGVPTALRDMGLADAASAARLKVAAALTPELADAPHSAAQRFHLDAPAWWRPPETPDGLPAVAGAVWEDRRLAVRYRRRDGEEVERDLEPYGLVLKAGVWYLVARVTGGAGAAWDGRDPGGEHRVYRVDRLVRAEPLTERFERDEEFDLSAFWEERAAAFVRSILRETVVVRLTDEGVRALRHAVDRTVAEEALERGETHGRADADGRRLTTVTLPVESLDVAYTQLLALGPECEVLEPPALRERMARAAERAAALYR